MFNAFNLVIAAGVIPFTLATDPRYAPLPLWPALIVSGVLVLIATSFAVKVGCLDEPERLGFRVVLRRLRKVEVDKRLVMVAGAVGLIFLVPGVALALVSHALGWLPEVKTWDLVLAGSFAFFMAVGLSVMLFEGIRSFKFVGSARDALKTEVSLQKAMSKATACDQVVALSRLALSGDRDVDDVRVAITYMTAAHRVVSSKRLPREPAWLMDADKSRVRMALSNLLRAMEGRVAADFQEAIVPKRTPAVEVV